MPDERRSGDPERCDAMALGQFAQSSNNFVGSPSGSERGVDFKQTPPAARLQAVKQQRRFAPSACLWLCIFSVQFLLFFFFFSVDVITVCLFCFLFFFASLI